MAQPDLSQYKKLRLNGMDYYIEKREDGGEVLRYITIWSNANVVEVPADGVGISVVEEGDTVRIKIGDKELGG